MLPKVNNVNIQVKRGGSDGDGVTSSSSSTHTGLLQSFRKTKWANLWDLFLFRFCMGLAVQLYRSNFAMILDYKYSASPKVTGYLISYSATVSTVTGFFAGRVPSFYTNDQTLLLHTAVVQLLTITALALGPPLWILLMCLVPLSLAQSVASVCTVNLTLARGKGQEAGVLLGMRASVLSMARMISPAVGGIAQEVHMSGPATVAAVAAAIAVAILMFIPEVK